jgi:hypothetical protein
VHDALRGILEIPGRGTVGSLTLFVARSKTFTVNRQLSVPMCSSHGCALPSDAVLPSMRKKMYPGFHAQNMPLSNPNGKAIVLASR